MTPEQNLACRQAGLIAKIKELRQIQPRKNWVVLTKTEILGPEEKTCLPVGRELKIPVFSQIQSIFKLLTFKPAFAGLTFAFILFGVYALAQQSLPGDFFYPIKRVAEKSKTAFVSEENQLQAQLETAQRRLDELTKIAQTNQIKKLAPAIQEYQASLMEAAKNIARVAATTSDSSVIQEIFASAQKLEQNKEMLEKTYGISGLDPQEDFNPTKIITEWLIKDLETRSMSLEQEMLLLKAKADFDAKDYNASLEKILNLSQLNYPQD